MDLGWKVLIPASLGWFLLIAALNIANDQGWQSWIVILVGLTAISVGALALMAAIRKAKMQRASQAFEEAN